MALPDEEWPTSNSEPMLALCQTNVAELPHRSDHLADIAMITVFMDQHELPRGYNANGDRWLLRAYPSIDGLVAMQSPSHRGHITPYPIRWELESEDYPTWDDVTTTFDLFDQDNDGYEDLFPTVDGTKVGGWPTTIQSEIYWAPFNQHPANPEYAFQIASETKANWAWGHGGTGYFGRGTAEHPDVWALEWQCY